MLMGTPCPYNGVNRPLDRFSVALSLEKVGFLVVCANGLILLLPNGVFAKLTRPRDAPTRTWSKPDFPVVLELLPTSRHIGTNLMVVSASAITTRCDQRSGNSNQGSQKFILDTAEISTTIWLWICWIQHLRLCLIQPAGR